MAMNLINMPGAESRGGIIAIVRNGLFATRKQGHIPHER
jgi:hypothetical protein